MTLVRIVEIVIDTFGDVAAETLEVGRRRFVPAAEFMRLFDTPMTPDLESFRRDVSEGIDHDLYDPYERHS